MLTLTEISYFFKVFVFLSATSMVFNPSVISIVATFSGIVLVAIIDIIDTLRESIEWYEETNNED